MVHKESFVSHLNAPEKNLKLWALWTWYIEFETQIMNREWMKHICFVVSEEELWKKNYHRKENNFRSFLFHIVLVAFSTVIKIILFFV